MILTVIAVTAAALIIPGMVIADPENECDIDELALMYEVDEYVLLQMSAYCEWYYDAKSQVTQLEEKVDVLLFEVTGRTVS